MSEFTNDAGYITSADVPEQVKSDWNATSGPAQILNKPTIPAAQVNADWNATSGVAQIMNKPTIPAAQVNSDWNATSGAAEILNKPTISELQIQSISNDTLYFTNGTFAVMSTDWSNVTNKPAFSAVAFTNDYNDLSNKPDTISHFTNDAGYITAADIPAQAQSDWNETDMSSPAYINNKPNMDDYLTDADMSNYVTKTEDETIGGEKTFTDFTTFDDDASFNYDVYFNDYTYFYNFSYFYDDVSFEDWVGFYDDIYVSYYTGRLRVPSVLSSISSDGTLNISDNKDDNTCNNAVNF